jgi:hypothetical protein
MLAQSTPLPLLLGPPCRGGGLRPTAQASAIDACHIMPLHQGTHWICPKNDHADPSPAPMDADLPPTVAETPPHGGRSLEHCVMSPSTLPATMRTVGRGHIVTPSTKIPCATEDEGAPTATIPASYAGCASNPC